MKKKNNYYSVQVIIKRILEGRITPVNFLILVGFAASLALLYICLHVYSYTLSEQVNSASSRARFLREKKIWLMADYNKLTSPEKIIPEVQKMGMRPGSSVDISELTLYRRSRPFEGDASEVPEVSSVETGAGLTDDNLENR